MIDQYADSLFIAMSKQLLNKKRWCNEKLGLCTHLKVQQIDVEDVVSDILATKPVELANDDYVDNMYEQIALDQTPRQIIKAVHISDVHLDALYSPGSNAQCENFLCCRDEYGPP